MLELDSISLHFGQHPALTGVGLSIAAGEQIALIGPSGSGKSSLLKLIATEYQASSGSLSMGGLNPDTIDAKALKKWRQSISYIPQHLALIPNLNVAQNILLGQVGQQSTLATLGNLVRPNQVQLERVHTLLHEVGIPEKLYHRADTLSGGQLQRVAIARALYQKSSIILADEPVSAVDPSRAHALLECLTQVATEHQVTLICSLHNLDYAKRFFSNMIGMREGRVSYQGSSEHFSIRDFEDLYSLQHG
ncbi:phosphonate ABC transporter ATP-binding protein [Rubritalea marina]|uniref:phosphonate ABC transporter ATP-binding protein n=1 Tax=Rubritalea marina TaxID=361055 RepID=UPI00036D4971|nr:ATP-binding cassette domain-containing protein [Rubritalea marina]